MPSNTVAVKKLVFRDVVCTNATFTISLMKADNNVSQFSSTPSSNNAVSFTFTNMDALIKYTEPLYTVAVEGMSLGFDVYYINYLIDATVQAGGSMTLGSMEAFLQVQ